MSYERLQLIDLVDKWDTKKIEHLENGIVSNENNLNALEYKVNNKKIEDYFQTFTYEQREITSGDVQSYIEPETGYEVFTYTNERYFKFQDPINELYIHLEYPLAYYGVFFTITEDDPNGSYVYTDDGFIYEYISNNADIESLKYLKLTHYYNENIDDKIEIQCRAVFGSKIRISQKQKIQTSSTLDSKYLNDDIARAPHTYLRDINEAPTADDYNTLLAVLREAGILS